MGVSRRRRRARPTDVGQCAQTREIRTGGQTPGQRISSAKSVRKTAIRPWQRRGMVLLRQYLLEPIAAARRLAAAAEVRTGDARRLARDSERQVARWWRRVLRAG